MSSADARARLARTEAVAAESDWRPRRRSGVRRGTARAAVRVGVFLVDPWGPSRLRRWLHVSGARLAVGAPVRSVQQRRRAASRPHETAAAETVGPPVGEMAGGGAA